MPPPVRNPDWTPDNGQPEWISYADLGPRGIPKGQLNSTNSTQSGQADPMPMATYDRSTAVIPVHVPTDMLLNTGVPSDSGVPQNTGTPTNTGVLTNIAPSNNTGTSQHSIGGPKLPSIHASTDLHTTALASRPGNEDGSWEATLQQTRKLLRLRGKRYGRHVQSFEDHARFKRARKHLLRKNTVDQSGDMPQDPAGQQSLVARLVNAMSNLDGIETRKTRKHPMKEGKTRIIDSVGVKCVKDMGEFDLEMLAWDFMVSMRDAQKGHLELPAKFNFKAYDTFMERFDDLESCLRFNKQLIRSAVQSNEWVDRIAAHPREERSRKKTNEKVNASKCEALTLARQLKKNGAAGSRTTHQAPTDMLAKSSAMISDSELMQDQPQSQLEQAQRFQQQYLQPQAFEDPQQPPRQLLDYSQHVNVQPQHVEIHMYYPNPEQYRDLQQRFEGHIEPGNPQQLPGPHPSENYLWIENREGLEQPPGHHGDPEQHWNFQEIDNPVQSESPQRNESPPKSQQGQTSQPIEHPQQHVSPQQQHHQPAAVPEPVATAAATPVTYDGPQSP